MVRPNARLTWPGVLSWRLKRQRLDRRAQRGEALGVVREICGLHAPGWVRRATQEEAERLARFVGGGLEIEWYSP